MYYENLPYYLPRLEHDQEIESWIDIALSICNLPRQEFLARLSHSFRVDDVDTGDFDRTSTALGIALGPVDTIAVPQR